MALLLEMVAAQQQRLRHIVQARCGVLLLGPEVGLDLGAPPVQQAARHLPALLDDLCAGLFARLVNVLHLLFGLVSDRRRGGSSSVCQI